VHVAGPGLAIAVSPLIPVWFDGADHVTVIDESPAVALASTGAAGAADERDTGVAAALSLSPPWLAVIVHVPTPTTATVAWLRPFSGSVHTPGVVVAKDTGRWVDALVVTSPVRRRSRRPPAARR
jgi:hypothetical protein